MLRSTVIAALVSALLFSTTAFANDRGPQQLWSGFYIGAHGGYAWQDAEINFDSGDDRIESLRSLDFNSPLLGVQAGYRRQAGKVVMGIEVDYSHRFADSFNFANNDSVRDPESGKSEVDYMASARAVLGYELGNLMVYVTGGIAAVNFELSIIDPDSTDTPSATGEHLAVGPVAGFGLEWAFNQNWHAGAKFLHYFTGKNNPLRELAEFNDSDLGDFAKTDDVTVVRLELIRQF